MGMNPRFLRILIWALFIYLRAHLISSTLDPYLPNILILRAAVSVYLCRMKIFSWMRSKVRGNDNTVKPEPQPTMPCDTMRQEGESSGSSSTLLAIGTFGNNLKNSDTANIEESCNEDEDVDQELLRLLLNKHVSLDPSFSGHQSNNYNPTTEKFLDILEEEEEEIIVDSITDASQVKDALLRRREKGAPSENRGKAMYKKSFSFLLKRALLCGGGFVHSPVISPVLKDPFTDLTLDHSRMEKILRTMLRKKKYPQRQRYLDMPGNDNDEDQGQTSNGETYLEMCNTGGNQDQMTLLQPNKVKSKSSRYSRR
ncbi:hypothetical protein ABFS83_12G130300 [Erythranthe nasuta]